MEVEEDHLGLSSQRMDSHLLPPQRRCATATSFSATADGEQAALLIQFSQADAGGFVRVVFQRLETWPSGLAAFLGVRAAGVEGAAAGRVEWRRWISG